MGKAIATHISYNFAGFDLIGIFDNSEQVVGQQIADLRVLPAAGIRRFCSENAPLMAILCVPDSAVKSVVELLYDIGIKSYWNFSHYDIALRYPDTIVENVHLNDSMMTLCYRVTENEKVLKSQKMAVDNSAASCYNNWAVKRDGKKNMQVWRNWQTRMVQVHMNASSCRFKSCYLHQKTIVE